VEQQDILLSTFARFAGNIVVDEDHNGTMTWNELLRTEGEHQLSNTITLPLQALEISIFENKA
jgi:hypothetical protein